MKQIHKGIDIEYDIKRMKYANGTIMSEGYYIHDLIHRADGPAIIWYYENGIVERECYYFNDYLHRMNAPAVITYHENGTIERELYYKNDIDITNALLQAHYFEADMYTKALIWNMI